MALKAGYYGLKRSLLNKVKELPGIKSIGSGLSLNSTTGELEATGTTISIEANPEGAATENLIKLGLGDDIYAVPDASKTYQTDDATESSIVDADYIPFFDSSAASGDGAPKKSTWTNFISKIKAKITEFVTWEANSVLGAKNLLPNEMVSSDIATVNFDGSITLNGTTSAVLNAKICTLFEHDLPKGRYILSIGDVNLDAGAQGVVAANAYDGSTSKGQLVGVHRNEIAFDVDYNGYDRVEFVIYLQTGNSYSNVVVKPMLRLAADIDDNYVPYAMTNRELTENLPIATAGTLDDIVNIISQKSMSIILSTNTHLIDALTDNDLQDTTCKILAFRGAGGIIDWYGMVGASNFCIGRITNGAYTSHKKATLS